MFPLFDPLALTFFNGLVALTMCFCFSVFFKTGKVYRGFGYWCVAAGLFGVGGVLIGLRGFIPGFISVVVSNVLAMSGVILIKWGLQAFYEIERQPIFDATVMATLAIFQTYFFYTPVIDMRSMIIALCHGSVLLQCAMIVIRASQSASSRAGWLLCRALILLSGYNLLRSIFHFLLVLAPNELYSKILFGVSMMILAIGTIIMFIGLLVINAQRLEDGLTRAQAEIVTLSGLLPICCHCKKIRSESQEWQPVEQYIHEHSAAEFSHGICPECLEKHYQDVG